MKENCIFSREHTQKKKKRKKIQFPDNFVDLLNSDVAVATAAVVVTQMNVYLNHMITIMM